MGTRGEGDRQTRFSPSLLLFSTLLRGSNCDLNIPFRVFWMSSSISRDAMRG